MKYKLPGVSAGQPVNDAYWLLFWRLNCRLVEAVSPDAFSSCGMLLSALRRLMAGGGIVCGAAAAAALSVNLSGVCNPFSPLFLRGVGFTLLHSWHGENPKSSGSTPPGEPRKTSHYVQGLDPVQILQSPPG